MTFPTPCIPRVEPMHSHRKFVEATTPECVMVNIVDARRLVKRGETAESYFPEKTEVMVTTTVDDSKLRMISWEKELEIIRQFSPDYHLPTDYAVYRRQHPDERLENIKKCLDGTLWMQEQLEGDIEIIPLLKGLEPKERRLCYQVFDKMETDKTALYVTQYFSSGDGNNITRVEEITESIGEHTSLEVLIIGLLSPNYLSRLDPCVTAAAGQYQWRTRVTPTKQNKLEIKETYDNLRKEVTNSLG